MKTLRSPFARGGRQSLGEGLLGFLIAMLILCAVRPSECHEIQGEVVLGMSTALSGPTAVLGINMRAGVMAGIAEVNRSGGIRGHTLRLIALDDGYEPSRTAPNMRRLIEKEGVVAIIGNVGTPTAVVAIPIADMHKVPFFGAFSGAGVLRKTPPDRYVVNYRASYAEEVGAMVDALIVHGGLKPREIAFFTQRDAYGDAGFSGGIAALKRFGLTDPNIVAHSRYERNTLAVENALADLLLAHPQPRAVVMVGTYAPCAHFIRLSRQIGFSPVFLNVSFVGAEPLLAALDRQGDGVIVTQVVPHFDSNLPMVQRYREALSAWDSGVSPTFGSLEGYIAFRILRLALEKIEGQPTRETIIDRLIGLGSFDVGLEEELHLDSQDHQACHRVWPTIFKNGEIVPFEWTNLAAMRGRTVNE